MVKARTLLIALTCLGATARVFAWAYVHPDLHPDAFFQYWEPAWWHLHGYGWHSWEWEIGLRSWLLPAYNGAWIAFFEAIGIRNPHHLFRIMLLHWALLSAAIVPAAWRMGAALQKRFGNASGSVSVPAFTALFAAIMPVLIHFSPQTIIEVPGTLLFVWGYCHWLESRVRFGEAEARSALWAGLALSLGACLRIPNGPLALVPVLDMLLRRRFRPALACMGAAMIPLGVFAITDWVTWGRPLHSALAFVQYNFIEGRAIEHGISPRDQYFDEIRTWLGVAVIPLAILITTQLRRVWPLFLPAVFLVCLLATQPHKESRFILLPWALGTLSAGGALGFIVSALGRRFGRESLLRVLGLMFAGGVTIVHARGLTKMPALDYSHKWPVYEAESWAGTQPDLTGLLVADRLHLSGGWALIGKNVPFEVLHQGTIGNPIFNYAIAPRELDALCLQNRMHVVWEKENFRVWTR